MAEQTKNKNEKQWYRFFASEWSDEAKNFESAQKLIKNKWFRSELCLDDG